MTRSDRWASHGGTVERRDRTRLLGPLGCFLAVATPVLVIVFGVGLNPTPANGRAHRMQSKGAAIVAAIEAHRESSGSYPETLSALRSSDSAWSYWSYEVTAEGKARLSIGDYFVDGYCVSWKSESGWHVDT